MPIKHVLALCPALALLILISGCNWQATPDNRAANEAAIRDLDAQWSKTAAAHDLNGTLSYYSDDAVLQRLPQRLQRGARVLWHFV